MSTFLDAYNALSPSSPRSDVSSVLQSITDAFSSQIDASHRKQLVQTIIDDLTKCGNGNGKKGRLCSKDAYPALAAVKALGKDPAGSEIIATPANLSALLSLSQSFKDNADASNEALRCIANALLLISNARETFIQKSIGGGEAALEMLEKSTNPERIFLASRILFLCTASLASGGDFIKMLVESKPSGHPGNIIEVVNAKLDSLSRSIMNGAKLSREAMTDLLKLTFNLLAHYPKIASDAQEISAKSEGEAEVMGDRWSDRLDGFLPPLLRTFLTLPPTFPSPLSAPTTHVIHNLIAIPVTPSLHTKWFPAAASPRSSKGRDSPLPSPGSSSGSNSGSPTLGPAKDVKHSAFDRAFSALAAGRRSLSLTRSGSPQLSPPADVLLRAYDLLDVSLAHYLPGAVDPDDSSVRERCRKQGETLDDVLPPLVLLIGKLCTADEGARTRMREWILPADLDRTSPLEGRADMLGRSLRLLASVHHTKLKMATGEMLYAVCDSDASLLASYVGYGNVAGFLFHKGITGQPSRVSNSTVPSTTPSGAPINPITGVVETPKPEIDMTDEEKEREAEKLFVLFDRLEKSGAIQPGQNPIRKAAAEGKLG
ncbi:uncharacterized protein LAESUDRAFT_34602 [Laetiporus sulphureus 93-53]|uniref:Guanine nucleotide exchange factor n=1 Tax=Laetiporus sulphureus 93-53 TaxID=1314785 RepID=A0A165IKG4_9APHY|nr:uncharacterized protein LAESUDRAFT_34602 [Laetiporus sulphureus 93-53]KZT13202.1 hypothetical protein LAESUDRAFT_34602 [Laetiporus sulphureus 93-53]